MSETWSSVELARELGISRQRVAVLAARWEWAKVDGRWTASAAQADQLRAHVRAWRARAAAPCSVDGCKKRATAGGLCSAHYQRRRRHGSTESRAGAHQREKSSCPAGHEYTPENTLIERTGRRRCRTCKRDRERKI